MPRSKSGVKRTPVNLENLKAAVEAVTRIDRGKLSLREAGKLHNVPIATLYRHVHNHKVKCAAEFAYESNLSSKKAFTRDEEKELVEYIVKVAKMHYGLTKTAVRTLAFKYAKAKNKKLHISWEENQKAGKEWMRHFMKRHENRLAIRKLEATSLARTAFNKINHDRFMTNLEDVHCHYGPIPPERIWNLGETDCSTVQVPPESVEQLGSTTSAEKVKVICAVSAIGNRIPPMFIFPSVNFKDNMLAGAPTGSVSYTNPSVCSNDEQFVNFMKHFIKHSKPSKEEPILLILDNNESHFTLQVVEMASQSGIKMLMFPPHTAGQLQPLDLIVFGHFKTYYNQALDAWHLNNPGKTFGIENVAEAVGLAFSGAFTHHNICSGFRCSGIYPLDRAAFCDNDFQQASITDRSNPNETSSRSIIVPLRAISPTQEQNSSLDATDAVSSHLPQGNEEHATTYGTSSLPLSAPHQSVLNNRRWTPKEVPPYPKAPPRKENLKEQTSVNSDDIVSVIIKPGVSSEEQTSDNSNEIFNITIKQEPGLSSDEEISVNCDAIVSVMIKQEPVDSLEGERSDSCHQWLPVNCKEELDLPRVEVHHNDNLACLKRGKDPVTTRKLTNPKKSIQKKNRLGENRFSCNRCFNQFSRKDSLKEHMVIHSGKKPFTCNQCFKQFTHRSSLNRHMYTHSGEKRFSCDLCFKQFTQKSSVKKHMLLHSE